MRLFKKKDDSKSKSSSPAPQDNPYAQPVVDNPYASGGNPYNNARPDAYSQPPQQSYGSNERVDNKYSANTYGASSGYGADKYNTADTKQRPTSRYGAGGYGGFQGRDPYSKQEDPNRNALFSGASERAAQNKLNDNAPPPYDTGSSTGDYRSGNSGYNSQPYNAGPKYDDRQLTAEEEEEESINATKQDIRAIKQKDVAATRNALRLAQQAEEIGRDTLTRLGVQSDMLHTTANNLELAHNQNKIAEDKARELKTLNRSMFAIHVSNPLTSKSREAGRDAAVRQRHEEEQAEREALRKQQFQSSQRMEKTFNDLNNSRNTTQQRQKNLAERSKYQFEADSEDEEMENELDNNLNALSGVVNNIRLGAQAIGKEVEQQNVIVGDIADKSDRVDLGITRNTAKLNRIK